MSYVLSKSGPSAARENTSPTSGRDIVGSPSGNLGVPGSSASPSQSPDANRPSRTPSPRLEGSSNHRRTSSALASLVANSAANAGAIAGMAPESNARVHNQNPELNPSEDPPKEASSASIHEGTAPTPTAGDASLQDVSQTDRVLPVPPEGDSSANQPSASSPALPPTEQAKDQEATTTPSAS